MFTDEEQLKIDSLCKESPEFCHIIRRLKEESHYMLSSISHELRNPIALINSTVQLMEVRNPEVLEIKYWSHLKNDIKDTVSLLEEYSNYNHSDDIRLSTINLYDLISDIKDNFDMINQNKNINITINTTKNSFKNITHYRCDIVKMKQVFTNILKNAAEAIGTEGYIHININADPTLLCKNIDGNTYMIISISNNGNQIDEDELPNIFEPFVTHKVGGTGLGLAIVNRIITSHGGSIQAYSDDGVTSFQIMLPILN